jgi:predicted dehydrogenase
MDSSNDNTKDFLVIGAGSIGRRHIQCLYDLGVQNVYISDPSQEIRTKTCGLFNIRKSFECVDDAIQRRYDGVIVAVPNHLHAEIACKVIEAKMDLMLEKPIEINLESALKIKKAVEANNVICHIAYCFRFNPGLQDIFKILQSNRLGKVYSADIISAYYLPDWRPGADYRMTYSAQRSQGGGVCLDLSHQYDYFRWLFGEAKEILSVTKKVSDLEIDVEDVSETIIVTEKDVIGRVHLDYLSRAQRHRLFVYAREGVLEYDFIKGQLSVTTAGEEFTQLKQYSTDRNVIYRNQLRHFMDCVRERKQPLVPPNDAIKTLELALEARQGFRY